MKTLGSPSFSVVVLKNFLKVKMKYFLCLLIVDPRKCSSYSPPWRSETGAGYYKADECGPLPEPWFAGKVLATNVFIFESASPSRASCLCVLLLSKQSDIGWYLWNNTPKDPAGFSSCWSKASGYMNALHNKHSCVFQFLQSSHTAISLTLAFMFSFPRCGVCLPAAQSCAQRPCSVDAGHPPPAPGEGLQAPGPPAPPIGWLDQGRRCALGLADEAACSCAWGRGPGSQVNHCCCLPISHVICWAHRGEPFPDLGDGTQKCRLRFYLEEQMSLWGLCHEQILKSSSLSSLSNLIMFPFSAYQNARNAKSNLLYTAFENMEAGVWNEVDRAM